MFNLLAVVSLVLCARLRASFRANINLQKRPWAAMIPALTAIGSGTLTAPLRQGIVVMQQGAPPTSFRELLDRYQRGERDFSNAELDTDPDSDLSGACLDNVDFSR